MGSCAAVLISLIQKVFSTPSLMKTFMYNAIYWLPIWEISCLRKYTWQITQNKQPFINYVSIKWNNGDVYLKGLIQHLLHFCLCDLKRWNWIFLVDRGHIHIQGASKLLIKSMSLWPRLETNKLGEVSILQISLQLKLRSLLYF